MEECKLSTTFLTDIIKLADPHRIFIEVEEHAKIPFKNINIRRKSHKENIPRTILSFNQKDRTSERILMYLNSTDNIQKWIYNISIVCIEKAIELYDYSGLKDNIKNKTHYIFGQNIKINDIKHKNPKGQLVYISIGDLYFYEHSLRNTRAFLAADIQSKATEEKRKFDSYSLPF